MNEVNIFKLKLKINELLLIWQDFCRAHSTLYDQTSEEYLHLLSSDIEKLEEIIADKNITIQLITKLDNQRKMIIEELNTEFHFENISKISEVVELTKTYLNDSEGTRLEKLNLLLLDIVEKIQDQNKLNQLFLNKAILSLQDLKNSFSGRKTFKTYGANGVTKTNHVST